MSRLEQIDMIMNLLNNEFKNVFQLNSSEIQVEMENKINLIYENLQKEAVFRQNYNDLLFYKEGIETMPAYYGFQWTTEYFLPFIYKMNPTTILILELITLVYSKSIYEMISSDINIIKRNGKDNELFFGKDSIYFILKKEGNCLNYYISILQDLFIYQSKVSQLTNATYISSEMYCNITDKLLEDTYEAKFNDIVQKIIGIYTPYFNKITYFTDVQPLFLKIIYECLVNFGDILKLNNLYTKRE